MTLDNQLIILPTRSQILFLKKNEIIYCLAHGSYTEIVTSDGRSSTASKRISKIHDKLDSNSFIRIHNSILINKSFVNKILNTNKIDLIEMQDGSQHPISRRKKKNVFDLLMRLPY